VRWRGGTNTLLKEHVYMYMMDGTSALVLIGVVLVGTLMLLLALGIVAFVLIKKIRKQKSRDGEEVWR
jgi:hypothetical protein